MSDEYKDVVERLEESRDEIDAKGDALVLNGKLKDPMTGLLTRAQNNINETLALLKRYREGLEKLSSKNAFFPAWELKTILREGKNPFEEDGKLRINYAKQILGGSNECKVNKFSSRICERGTKSCEVYHDD